MERPLVSIVIPVFNASRYLPKCLNSILSQTYDRIEVICVNDGSTDNSLNILREYSLKDQRIKLINTENHGVSQARNIGIHNAEGSMFLFVDSDDWIESDCLETLVQFSESQRCDIVMFPYIRERAGIALKRTLFESSKVFIGDECKRLARRMIGPIGDEISSPISLDSYGTVWGKLYNRKVVEGIKFVDLSIIGTAEDSLYNMFVFKRAETVGYCQDVYYHYRRDNKSSLTYGSIPKLQEKWHAAFAIIANHFSREDEKQALSNRIALSSLGLLINAYSSENYRKEISDVLNDVYIQRALYDFQTENLQLKWKFFYYFVKHKMTNAIILTLYLIQFIRHL